MVHALGALRWRRCKETHSSLFRLFVTGLRQFVNAFSAIASTQDPPLEESSANILLGQRCDEFFVTFEEIGADHH
jgi:hypothetical protein